MRIQFLSFPGCPNAEPALHALREAMDAEHITTAIDEVDVSRDDAPASIRGWGSPTILIDGVDVGGESAPQGSSCCRLYRGGYPSVAAIRARLTAR